MLRYRMVVVTRDNALRRAVKRLTTATGSTAEFLPDASGLAAEPPVNLAIFDAREGKPDATFVKKVPPGAQIVYIVGGDQLVERLPLFEDGRVCSLFCHDERFDDDEFISTSTKALRGEVFGLQKYFPWGVTTFSVKVKNHEEKGRAIDILLEYANLAGVRGSVRDRIQLVCDELMMNALYHAPSDVQGAELYAGRTLKELAQLPEVSPIRVQYGCSGRYFGVSVRDEHGTLARDRLLGYLLRARDATKIEDKAGGAGLGLVSVLRSVSKLVFNLDRRYATEVIALFDMELFARGKMGARSLHVFSAPPHEDEEEDEAPAPQRAAAPRGGGRNGVWVVVALLLAAASALGTAVYMKRTGATLAVAEEPARPGEERTLTVYPEPQQAIVKLDGVQISPGQPTRIGDRAPGVVTVELPGYATRTLSAARMAGAQVMYVTLTPVVSPVP